MSLFPYDEQKKIMEEYIKNGFLDMLEGTLNEKVSAKSIIDTHGVY